MKNMNMLLASALNLLSAVAMAHPQDNTWGHLGLIEQIQILEAANYCDRQNGASLSVISTDIEFDGSVGYQGVYNYIYTTKFSILDKNGQELSHVRVISEHRANIDTTPISYAFRIVSANADSTTCEIP